MFLKSCFGKQVSCSGLVCRFWWPSQGAVRFCQWVDKAQLGGGVGGAGSACQGLTGDDATEKLA